MKSNTRAPYPTQNLSELCVFICRLAHGEAWLYLPAIESLSWSLLESLLAMVSVNEMYRIEAVMIFYLPS